VGGCEIKDWRAAVVGPKNSYAKRASSRTKQESGVSKLTWYIITFYVLTLLVPHLYLEFNICFATLSQ